MPELQIQTRTKKQTGKLTGKFSWDNLSYGEMISKVEKLAGPKPPVPAEIKFEPWSEQAIRVLKERYFLKDKEGNILETVEEMCWRVAWELARDEIKYGKKRAEVILKAKEYYRLMVNRWFLPNSPTLMNAGKGNGLQYSACYVIPVPDSLTGIFDGVKYQGLIHQSGGGTGFSFSRLRPKGSRVKSTMGIASGPVSFMRIYNEATQQIKQGGTRRGANMGILRVDHPDVLEFIHCKDDGVGITNFNISLAITDKFMKALAENGEYELIDPHNGEITGKLKASFVWQEIADSAWRTGDPGMIFIDRINAGVANPIRAPGWEVESTNPCVTGETLVSTDKGLVSIQDLYETRTTFKLLVDGRLETQSWQIPAQVIKTGIKQVYRLVTEEGYEMRLTGDHKVMTAMGWKEARDLVEGDELWVVNRKGGFGREGNLELGQVLGWLVGDGTMMATEAVLSFFGKEKYELAPKFAQKVSSLTQGMQVNNRDYSVGVGYIDKRDEARVGSVRLWRLAKEYGIEYGNKLVVPEKIFKGTQEMQMGFLQALFSADGHVEGSTEKGVSVRLTSVSESLLKDVQRLLLNFGIVSQIYTNRRDQLVRMMPDGKGGRKAYTCQAYHDLVISKSNLWVFAKEIGFLLEYKNDGLIDRLKAYDKGPYKEKFTATFSKLITEGEEWVYDLTEPVTNSFVANGLVVHNCGEQPLYPFDACNLGSVFLGYFVKDGQVEWERLKETVHTAVRLLDSVIDMNPFPLSQIEETVRKIRRIGLGVGGWADMLVELEIAYDSEEAMKLANKLMKFINDEGHQASQALAKERGSFPMWKQSVYAKDKPIRNSTVTTIAPTGTIGILANASGGIEPLFAIAYQHIVKSENRTLTFVNPSFEKMAREKDFYSEELMKKVAEHGVVRELTEIPEEVRQIFGTAHEVDPEWHVRTQAAFQKYTDNAVSKTINLRHDVTVDEVKKAYMLAWETGCMGITVFRDGCKSEQVLNLGTNQKTTDNTNIANNQVDTNHVELQTQVIKPRPVRVEGATYRIETPMGTAFITVNHDEVGNPFEVFITIGKAGSELAAMAEALGRLISTTLRFGNHMPAKERAKEIMEQLHGIGGGRSVGFGPNKVRSLPDAVARAIGMHFGLMGIKSEATANLPGPVVTGEQEQLFVEPESHHVANGHTQPMDFLTKKRDLCPKCGEAALTFEEGCKKCYGCGYSEC